MHANDDENCNVERNEGENDEKVCHIKRDCQIEEKYSEATQWSNIITASHVPLCNCKQKSKNEFRNVVMFNF